MSDLPERPPRPPQERRVELQLGDVGGVDVRPSRTFVWLGRREPGHEAIVSTGQAPRVPREPSAERSLHLGQVEITYAGNPAVTLPLSAYQVVRGLLKRRSEQGKPPRHGTPGSG
jgi:hypothetical protein